MSLRPRPVNVARSLQALPSHSGKRGPVNSRRAAPARTALVWFRRDLRLTGQSRAAPCPRARRARRACSSCIRRTRNDPGHRARPVAGGCITAWSHWTPACAKSAASSSCRRRRTRCRPCAVVIRETGATLVCWNKLYEPAALKRDAEVAAALDDDGVSVEQSNAALLFEPGTVLNQQERPYRVFTPFWRTAGKAVVDPAACPARRLANCRPFRAALLASPSTTSTSYPRSAGTKGWPTRWTPGEIGALKQLKQFGKHVAGYPTGRDRPDRVETSRLSPHLHFGEIGPRQVVAMLRHSHQGLRK